MAALAPGRPAAAFSPQASAIADSIRALDQAWARSYAMHDTGTAHALFAPDLVVTSGNGSLKNKEAELADVRPQPGLAMHYFRTGSVEIRIHSGAAIVTGIAEWEFTWNGRVSSNRRSYTSTWVRGGSLGWRMVALHLGPAPAR